VFPCAFLSLLLRGGQEGEMGMVCLETFVNSSAMKPLQELVGPINA
jgi:hypothetical protein